MLHWLSRGLLQLFTLWFLPPPISISSRSLPYFLREGNRHSRGEGMYMVGYIYITDLIDWETFESFSKRMAKFEQDDRYEAVVIELASPGGTALSAMAISSRMRVSRLHVTVEVYGCASSAASIIIATADQRRMAKEAWIMVHEDAGELSGTVVEIETESKQFRRFESQWNKVLEKVTNLPAVVWEKLNKKTTYLNAEQCLEAGIIDEII